MRAVMRLHNNSARTITTLARKRRSSVAETAHIQQQLTNNVKLFQLQHTAKDL